jgi:hypothetical protein
MAGGPSGGAGSFIGLGGMSGLISGGSGYFGITSGGSGRWSGTGLGAGIVIVYSTLTAELAAGDGGETCAATRKCARRERVQRSRLSDSPATRKLITSALA